MPPIPKQHVTFFDAFVKLTEDDSPLWAVGHTRGRLVVTRFNAELTQPTVDNIPEVGYFLSTMVDLLGHAPRSRAKQFNQAAYEQVKELAKESIEVPPHFIDKVRGTLFGQAVGDALGFGTEWVSKKRVAEEYPEGLRSYDQITRYGQIDNWSQGDWTDDTDQMLCILDSLLEKQTVDIHDIAARIHHWAITDGMGMGRTVYTAVHTPGFLDNPMGVAQKLWDESGQQWAANGGLMRTSVLGIWEFQNYKRVEQNAENVCRITHADPRCVGSCVIFCSIVMELVCGNHKVDKLTEKAIELGRNFHPEIEIYITKATESLDALDLDEGLNPGETDRVGYTLKTLGAAFWALNQAESFEDGILKIIHEGGDADTNAAVAGALLGAKFGYETIPQAWIDGLVHYQSLKERVDRFADLAYRQMYK